jgi:kynurenine formamidase
MCAPSVIESVRQDLSRRGFLTALGGTIAATVTTPESAFAQQTRKPLRLPKEIVGAGVDTLSLDISAARKFVARLALLGAGKYAIELLANLPSVPPAGATLIVGAPKHEGASGGPVRVFAVV